MIEFNEIVITESYSLDEIYTEVYVVLIDKKDTSFTLELFSNDIPLQEYGLNHLKRIQPLHRLDKNCQLQVILCPLSKFEDLPKGVKDFCQDKKRLIVTVSKLPPANRTEFESWNKCWPINFHASQLEKDREKGLNELEKEQLNVACAALSLEEENMTKCCKCSDAAVIVNPVNGRVVATSSSGLQILQNRLNFHAGQTNSIKLSHASTEEGDEGEGGNVKSGACGGGDSKHPSATMTSSLFSALYTPTMLCIEGVAEAVRGEGETPGVEGTTTFSHATGN